jgi:pimeloyl-ACP methyl ester carboxylesterase
MQSNPSLRRRRVAVAGVSALAVIAGAARATESPAGAHTDFHSGNAPPTLTWTGCGNGVQCATARVPLDYDRPEGKTISLAVIRRPATDSQHRIGSLFVNNGGPGNSVVDFVRGDATEVLSPEVQARFDIVGFDPRGVGRSTPVQCFASVDEQNEFFAARPGMPVGPDEIEAFSAGSKTLGRLCRQRNGDLLDHLSTANVARDMDLLRRAVGDEQLSFAGYSYGGMLGITYANLFPGRVRAMVLDGAPDPVEWTRTNGDANKVPFSVRLGSADATSKALGFFLDTCQAAGDGCAFASSDTRAKFDTMMARLLQQPVTIDTPEGPLEVSYGFVVDGIRGGLTFPPIWADLAGELEATWQATEATNAGVTATPFATDASPVEGYDNSGEALLSVACTDSTNPHNPKQWPALAADADAHAPYFGADWTFLVQPCATWPAHDHDRYTGPFTAKTANPLLFVNARFDAASSFEHTQAVVASIPGARLLTLEGAGHPASFVPDNCIASAVTAYVVDRQMPAEGASCQPEFRPFEATDQP